MKKEQGESWYDRGRCLRTRISSSPLNTSTAPIREKMVCFICIIISTTFFFLPIFFEGNAIHNIYITGIYPWISLLSNTPLNPIVCQRQNRLLLRRHLLLRRNHLIVRCSAELSKTSYPLIIFTLATLTRPFSDKSAKNILL